MQKILVFAISMAGLVFIWFLTSRGTITVSRLFGNTAPLESFVAESTKVVEELRKEIATPPPLRREERRESIPLTVSGTIRATNEERAKEGLLPFRENALLHTAAGLKVRDMFESQYFAHESPSGRDAGDLGEEVGYRYLRIGENLALGNFLGDVDLVAAWMASPGHRANILNEKFVEIGVAVGRGLFEGKTTWLAVQIFAVPASLCKEPGPTTRVLIEEREAELAIRAGTLRLKQEELEATSPKRGPHYRSMVEEYNALVEEYNQRMAELKALVATYNSAVETFNTCLQTVT